MIIVAKQDTFIKIKGDGSQAAELHDSEKFELLKGEELAVNWVKVEGGHTKFELEEHRKGRYNWYIWNGHKLQKKGKEEYKKIAIPESNGFDPTEPIDWNNPNSEVSKYFRVYEVTQRDKRRIPTNRQHQENILALANEVDKIRIAWNSGLVVTSWYRPNRPININKAVGGSSQSQHIPGLGIDIRPSNGELSKFRKFILNGKWRGGVGDGIATGKGFMHLDARAGFPCWGQGSPVATWGY